MAAQPSEVRSSLNSGSTSGRQLRLLCWVTCGHVPIVLTFAGRFALFCTERVCRNSEQRQKRDTARHKKCANGPDDPEAFFHDEDAD